jgi:4,5-dihydroxyphthalate decarboxylase
MSVADGVTVFCADYEHCLSLTGRFDNVELTHEKRTTREMFPLALGRAPFDVLEFSLSNYIMLRDRGADWLTAVPIFPYRRFRHGIAYVKRDSALEDPASLEGCRIGVPDFSMTAAVWARGILKSFYGFDWRSAAWTSGPKQRFTPPADVPLRQVESDLESLLSDGEIDVLLTPDLSRKAAEAGTFRPLFRDPVAEEGAFFDKTGVYPPNHVIVINRDCVAEPVRLAAPLFRAFETSKKQAYARRLGSTLLPWGETRWTDVIKRFGPDPLPYGDSAQNRTCVDMLAGFLLEQGLIRRPWTWDELFLPADYAGLRDEIGRGA